MKIRELLSERVFNINLKYGSIEYKDMKVLENPLSEAVFNYAMTSKDKELRGVLLGDDIYWWDAYYCMHQTFAKEIGRLSEYNIENRYILYYVHERGYCLIGLDPPDLEIVKNFPNFRRSIDHPNILIKMYHENFSIKDIEQM